MKVGADKSDNHISPTDSRVSINTVKPVTTINKTQVGVHCKPSLETVLVCYRSEWHPVVRPWASVVKLPTGLSFLVWSNSYV
jgi:hypothetical protein